MPNKSLEKRKFLFTREVCPECAGEGMVEICSIESQDCYTETCSRCNGTGYLIKYNTKNIFFSIAFIVVLITSGLYFF